MLNIIAFILALFSPRADSPIDGLAAPSDAAAADIYKPRPRCPEGIDPKHTDWCV